MTENTTWHTDEAIDCIPNMLKTLRGGLILIWNTERNRDPWEHPRMVAWGITLGQKITWFLLYAHHCDWWPGKRFWRIMFPLLGRTKSLRSYEKSITLPNSFWARPSTEVPK